MLNYLASNKVEFLGAASAKLQIPAHYVPRHCGKGVEPMGWKLEKILPEPGQESRNQEPKRRSILAAIMKSLSVRPSILWVQRVVSTLPQLSRMSG